jgi:hypothetical protein
MNGKGASAHAVEHATRGSFVIPALLVGVLLAYGVFGLGLYMIYATIF